MSAFAKSNSLLFRTGLSAIALIAAAGMSACAEPSHHDEAPAAAEAPAAPVQALVPLEVEIFAPEGTPIPRFAVDAAWPQMPTGMIIGQTPGLDVDADDNVWIAQRPHTLGGTDTGLAQDPPIANCCIPGPSVMQFAPDGTYLNGWGGPDIAPDIDGVNQWPRNIHGLHIADDGTVWVGGNGDGDHVVLNFTMDGEYIRQIGVHGSTSGNTSDVHLGNPADIYQDDNGIIVADGYINKRIAEFDGDALTFNAAYGAYAADPSGGTREGTFDQSQATSTTDGGANPAALSFGDIVHCVVGNDEGLVFICDRRNNRAQVFQRNEAGELEFLRDIVVAPETGGTRTVSDISFSPDGEFIYIADMMNSHIWVLDADTYETLARYGRIGRYPGQFTWLHSVVSDSQGNLYTSEVNTGRRVQKLVFMGVE